ncbi:hypothetical protein [Actinomycetospora lemnae]|uniref:Superfamily III holin-X n=1 Tax=Actinomycetospora lemnae TaxID=3019891 RepID=A0ABT5SZJ4_9PSEU|nr:hypothetical protein [Actinomycetospora sp. DW7H6]MDD7968288.1 hypothetical protein [Actinomycetospora sp. DW7H6]
MTAAAAFDPVADGRPAPARPASVPDANPTSSGASSGASAASSGGPPSAGDRLRALAITAIDRLAGVAATKVEELADRLGDMAADAAKGQLPGGVGGNALVKAGLAAMQGKNPVVAAVKGAVGAMSTGTKVLVALLLILVAVLSPVVLLVAALVLLVAAIVGAVKN